MAACREYKLWFCKEVDGRDSFSSNQNTCKTDNFKIECRK